MSEVETGPSLKTITSGIKSAEYLLSILKPPTTAADEDLVAAKGELAKCRAFCDERLDAMGASPRPEDSDFVKNEIIPAWELFYRYVTLAVDFFPDLPASFAYFTKIRDCIISINDDNMRSRRKDVWDFAAALSYIQSAFGRAAAEMQRLPIGHCLSISQGLGELSAFLQRFDDRAFAALLPPEWKQIDQEVEKIRQFNTDYITYTKLLTVVQLVYAEFWALALVPIVA
jgi:hypothetical protein